jgi:hypothetical protein
MAAYWIIVRRENLELFEALAVAFRGRTGFRVILDRRQSSVSPRFPDRRGAALPYGPDEFIIAECYDPLPKGAPIAV